MCFLGGGTAGLAAELSLTFESEVLSADVSRAPLEDVLGSLAIKTDITIFLDQSLKDKKVSVRFSGLPLDEGIRKLISPYSSAIVYGKRRTPGQEDPYYVSEVKVFDKGKKEHAYVRVSQKDSRPGRMPDSGRVEQGNVTGGDVGTIPEWVKDPARAAAHHKRVSASLLRSKIVSVQARIRQLENGRRRDEEQKRRDIQEYRMELETTPEGDARSIQAKLNLRSGELKATQQRNSQELNRLRTELNQLKRRQVRLETLRGRGTDDSLPDR